MIIDSLLVVVALYLLAGFVFAIVFIIKGINVVDEGAHGSTIGFRLIIVPGLIVFWPVLLRKWLNAKKKNT